MGDSKVQHEESLADKITSFRRMRDMHLFHQSMKLSGVVDHFEGMPSDYRQSEKGNEDIDTIIEMAEQHVRACPDGSSSQLIAQHTVARTYINKARAGYGTLGQNDWNIKPIPEYFDKALDILAGLAVDTPKADMGSDLSIDAITAYAVKTILDMKSECSAYERWAQCIISTYKSEKDNAESDLDYGAEIDEGDKKSGFGKLDPESREIREEQSHKKILKAEYKLAVLRFVQGNEEETMKHFGRYMDHKKGILQGKAYDSEEQFPAYLASLISVIKMKTGMETAQTAQTQ